MFWKKPRRKHFYQKKTFVILIFILLLGISVRAILPSMMTSLANRELAEESPHFSFHIKDIDLHLFKGEYVVEGIVGTMKINKEKFLKIRSVVSEIPWESIFRGTITVDLLVHKMDLIVSEKLLQIAKKEGERIKRIIAEEEDEDDQMKPTPSFKIRSFALKDSNITIKDLLSFKGSDVRRISNIDVKLKNLTPDKERPVTNFKIFAKVFGPSPLVSVGEAKLRSDPVNWDMNMEIKNFKLKTMNPILKEKVKAFIQKGQLDLYVEAEAKEGEIKGYVKPFVRKMKMDTPPGGFDFKGAAAATGGNMVKLLLTDSEARTLASKIPFSFAKKLEYEVLPALTKAVEHRAKENISPGLEDRIGKKGLGIDEIEKIQAQEEAKR